MKEEVKQSAKHFDNMDVIDRAQQDAIEAMASRIEALTWVICVFMLIFASSIIMIIAGKNR